MISYTPRDFNRYFTNAWIRDAQGEVRKIDGTLDNENVQLSRFVAKIKKTDSKIVPLKSLDWDNIKQPRLGYCNVKMAGRNLYYVERAVGRITTKGFSNETISVETVPQVNNTMRFLNLDVHTYIDNAHVSQDVADACWNPSYTPLDIAIRELSLVPKATGFALSRNVAVVLGSTKQSTFTLLWKKHDAAFSEDGVTWNLVSEERKDNLTRAIGRLRYV